MVDTRYGLLRSLLAMMAGEDRRGTVAYVGLSVAVAMAGSAAAVLLVPLVAPGSAIPILGKVPTLLDGVGPRALLFATATATFALLRWFTARLAARLVGRFGLNLRRQVHARLIDAPLSSLADATSAEIANVLTYNVEIIVQGYSALQQLLVAGVTATVSVALAFWVSPPLVMAAPLLIGIGVFAARAYGREQSVVSRRYVADMTRLFWHSEDFPRRLRHVRSFGREQAEKASYGGVCVRLYHGYRRQLELIANGRLALELLAAAGIAAVFMLAPHWQGIDQASLLAVCLLLGRLLPYIVLTRQSFQQLRSASPAFALWRRHMHDAEAQPPATTPMSTPTMHIAHVRVMPPTGGIDVRGISLRPGSLTAVAGESGIGKSSLVDVLAGMATPSSFVASLGQQPLDFAGYRAVVRHGAYIGQGVRPWQATVRECLLWAAADASEAAMQDAIADVGLDPRLAGAIGLDTALNDASSRLSGGELQRLMLAQVILREPVIAVLDEATSALDMAAELTLLAVLRRRLPRTILLVVSHRPGVAAMADQCIVVGASSSVEWLTGRELRDDGNDAPLPRIRSFGRLDPVIDRV